MRDSYITLLKEGQSNFIEKRSEFIGYARPVDRQEECLSYIEEIKSKHKTARHIVYAYIIKEEGQILSRFTDDGEPQGTAGLPILDVLRKQNIINAIVVVVRYFGGTLLGAPGLVRAYGTAASMAVDEASLGEMILSVQVIIRVDYSYFGKLEYALSDYVSFSPEFTDKVTIKYIIAKDKLSQALNILNEITNGENDLRLEGELYYPLA